MTKPKPANPTLSISDADLASALARIGAEIDHQALRSSALARIMRETFLGSDAGGAWDWRKAYDLMQAAAVQVLLRADCAAGDIAAAKLLASRLLTETLRGERIEQVSTEDLWTCPKSGAVTRIIGLEVTDPVYILGADEAMSRNPDKLPMVNRASGRAALISARPMQMYDEDIVTLMRKAVRPNGSSYLEETRFEASAWEEIDRLEFARLWDEEAASLPKTTTTKLYLLTGLLLPIWKDIPTTNERIYRVTPDGATAMIGRTLSEEGAAALRARLLVSNPQTPQEMLTAALGTTAPVDLGRGLSLTCRRVAGEMRLELCGADRGMIESLKAMGCFTEIIAFQLRVFLPHGEGVGTEGILSRIVGTEPDAAQGVASVAAE